MSGWVGKKPLTSDRSAFCKGSRESQVNDRRQSWGAGGPEEARPGPESGLSTLTQVEPGQPQSKEPADLAEEEEARLPEQSGFECLSLRRASHRRGRNLLGNEGHHYAPGRSMAWPGPVGCLPSGLREEGPGPPSLLSFLGRTGSQGDLRNLVRDSGRRVSAPGSGINKAKGRCYRRAR